MRLGHESRGSICPATKRSKASSWMRGVARPVAGAQIKFWELTSAKHEPARPGDLGCERMFSIRAQQGLPRPCDGRRPPDFFRHGSWRLEAEQRAGAPNPPCSRIVPSTGRDRRSSTRGSVCKPIRARDDYGVMRESNLRVELTGANDQVIASRKHATSEWGSFSGSFVRTRKLH
jgi:hypothetical protein